MLNLRSSTNRKNFSSKGLHRRGQLLDCLEVGHEAHTATRRSSKRGNRPNQVRIKENVRPWGAVRRMADTQRMGLLNGFAMMASTLHQSSDVSTVYPWRAPPRARRTISRVVTCRIGGLSHLVGAELHSGERTPRSTQPVECRGLAGQVGRRRPFGPRQDADGPIGRADRRCPDVGTSAIDASHGRPSRGTRTIVDPGEFSGVSRSGPRRGTPGSRGGLVRGSVAAGCLVCVYRGKNAGIPAVV